MSWKVQKACWSSWFSGMQGWILWGKFIRFALFEFRLALTAAPIVGVGGGAEDFVGVSLGAEEGGDSFVHRPFGWG